VQDTQDKEEAKSSQVMWVDPDEEVERKRLTDHVNSLDTQDLGMGSTMNIPDNMTAMMEESDKENRRCPESFVFMVSSLPDGDVSIQDAIKKLGGKLSEVEGQFDSMATHMITTKVSRSEKMLCSVASGRWVLHHSYIASSLSQGRWLEEESFEWGNPANDFLDLTDGSTESKLAAAARRWRSKGRGCEAFAGMVMVLVMPSGKKEQFQRLVQAGGGEVVPGRPPYSNTKGITHLLTEARYLGKDKVDYAGLASKGVPVMKPIYLNDFLTSEEPPSLESFLLEEFKEHWEKKKRARVMTDTPTNPTKKTKSVLSEI